MVWGVEVQLGQVSGMVANLHRTCVCKYVGQGRVARPVQNTRVNNDCGPKRITNS